MNLLHFQMTKRKQYLENLKKQLEQEMKNFPEGNLRVSNDRGIPRYFHVLKASDTRGEYILKDNIELAHQLAQKDYNQIFYKTSTREIIYHEHFGLLDDEEYREANFAKLEEYRKNGIYLGKNLILTYEAEGHYLNIKEVKKLVGDIIFSL